jgi:hypothetical protein
MNLTIYCSSLKMVVSCEIQCGMEDYISDCAEKASYFPQDACLCRIAFRATGLAEHGVMEQNAKAR